MPIWNYLTAPMNPRTALGIAESHLALATLKRGGGEFVPRNLGVHRLPKGLVRADFTEPNITNEAGFIEHVNETLAQANQRRLRRLAAALPSGSTRSLVFSLESAPGSRAEMQQMIEWKVERHLNCPFNELQVSHARLADFNGRNQWLISAVHKRVLEQYERIFKQLGWHVGLVQPQHLSEAQLLIRAGGDDDQALVSLHEHGFDAVIVRGAEPILVREVVCTQDERENEFFRMMVYYRDRLVPENGTANLTRLLTLGNPTEQRRFRDVLASAVETFAVSLDPPQVGLRVEPNAPFRDFAAAAGLATMAWN